MMQCLQMWAELMGLPNRCLEDYGRPGVLTHTTCGGWVGAEKALTQTLERCRESANFQIVRGLTELPLSHNDGGSPSHVYWEIRFMNAPH